MNRTALGYLLRGTETRGDAQCSRAGEELELTVGVAPGGGLVSSWPCVEEVGVLRVPFSQQWCLGVACGEGTVNLLAPAGLDLPQLLGTLLGPQLSWGARGTLLLHLQLSILLLLLSFSLNPSLNLSVLSPSVL